MKNIYERLLLLGRADILLMRFYHWDKMEVPAFSFSWFFRLYNVLLRNLQKQPPEVFCKKRCWNFAKFTGKHLSQVLFFNKKDTLAQVFSCEFCEISKNTFFTERVWMTASEFLYLRKNYYKFCWCMKQFLNLIKVLLVYNPNYSSFFPPGHTWKMRCLIWCLNETWKPTRWRSCQSNLK